MWTGDERVFFYNPSQNISVWDCPEDIEDRVDVKKLVQTPPRLMQQAASAADDAAVAVTGNTSADSFQPGVPRWQPHRRSGLATLPSVGAVP